jgi:hypothetical protein
MDHCLAQVFRGGLAIAHRDFMTGPVIFHNLWMVNGDVRQALFKITC